MKVCSYRASLLIFMTFQFNALATQAGRLRIPDYVTCAPNQVTSWSGIVTAYHRTTHSLNLSIHTSADTDEELAMEFESTADLEHNTFINDQAYSSTEPTLSWDQIETSQNQLKIDVQLVVWLCDDESIRPVFNWITR